MKVAKVFLNGILCVILSTLFVIAGISIFGVSQRDSTARADNDSTVQIKYWVLVPDLDEDDAPWELGVNTGSTFESITFDDSRRNLTIVSEEGNREIALVSAPIALDVPPTIGLNGNAAPTVFNGTDDIDLTDAYVYNKILNNKNAWLYESSSNAKQLTALWYWNNTQHGSNTNILASDFVSSGASPTATINDVINLYCILPSDYITFDTGEKGDLLDSSSQPYSPVVQLAYQQIKHDFQIPDIKSTYYGKFRFDGWFTGPNGSGTRVTDKNGDMSGGDLKNTGWTLGSIILHAKYEEVYNITYFFDYNSETYSAKLQYDKYSGVTKDKIDEDIANQPAYDNEAYGQNSHAFTFPKDTMYIAEYCIDTELSMPITFPINANNLNLDTNNSIVLYLKLVQKYYTVTFDANGGEFNTHVTTITYNNILYNTTLGTVIDTYLTAALGTNPVSRTGYSWITGRWNTDPEAAISLSLTGEKVTENKTYYVIWQRHSVEITYHYDGTSKKDKDTVYYDSEIYSTVSLVTPTRTGYNFIGWAYASKDPDKNSFILDKRADTSAYNIIPKNITTDGIVYTLSDNPTNINNINIVQITADCGEKMPDNKIDLYALWIQAYTVKLALNQGYIKDIQNTPLAAADNNILITIENGETLLQALTRQNIADFFTNTSYAPILADCNFDGWYYYADKDFSNSDTFNCRQFDQTYLNMNIQQLILNNIDLTQDGVLAAKYTYNKDNSYYTVAPEDGTNTVFAIILIIISVILLIMLIMSHRNNGTLQINDKAIQAYKNIYGEDAPLPTFENTRPPFSTDDSPEVSTNTEKED